MDWVNESLSRKCITQDTFVTARRAKVVQAIRHEQRIRNELTRTVTLVQEIYHAEHICDDREFSRRKK